MSPSYAGEGFIRCPFCDNVVREEDIVQCPRCEREGCAWMPGSVEYPDGEPGCMPAGRNCLCPECEEEA